MTGGSYDYENRVGVLPISWDHFHGICKGLVRAIAAFDPEVVLAIGRGGYYAGTLISHMLQAEIYPVRLSRRVADVPTHKSPQWLLKPPELVEGKRVLLVDEICGSGETILMVKQEAEQMGAGEVRSAVLYTHTWGVLVPDYIGIISDALILNPWDREIFRDGEFRFHPEYVWALEQQGLGADASLLINAPRVGVEKG